MQWNIKMLCLQVLQCLVQEVKIKFSKINIKLCALIVLEIKMTFEIKTIFLVCDFKSSITYRGHCCIIYFTKMSSSVELGCTPAFYLQYQT